MQKKSKKKLTSVSFAFTHTYTLAKLTLLLFFPKRTWKILKFPLMLLFMVSLFKGRLTKKRFAKMWAGEGDILTT